MIIGHYAIGFAASRAEPALPLWQSMIAVVWLLGLLTSYTLGGLIHALLVIALVILILQLVTGRRPPP